MAPETVGLEERGRHRIGLRHEGAERKHGGEQEGGESQIRGGSARRSIQMGVELSCAQKSASPSPGCLAAFSLAWRHHLVYTNLDECTSQRLHERAQPGHPAAAGISCDGR